MITSIKKVNPIAVLDDAAKMSPKSESHLSSH